MEGTRYEFPVHFDEWDLGTYHLSKAVLDGSGSPPPSVTALRGTAATSSSSRRKTNTARWLEALIRPLKITDLFQPHPACGPQNCGMIATGNQLLF